MRGKRISALARAIEGRFPGTKVWVERYDPPDHDRGVKWFLWILNCPARKTPEVNRFAQRRADEIYGGGSIPMFISAASRTVTRRFFGAQMKGVSPRRARRPSGAKGVLLGAPRQRFARRVPV